MRRVSNELHRYCRVHLFQTLKQFLYKHTLSSFSLLFYCIWGRYSQIPLNMDWSDESYNFFKRFFFRSEFVSHKRFPILDEGLLFSGKHGLLFSDKHPLENVAAQSGDCSLKCCKEASWENNSEQSQKATDNHKINKTSSFSEKIQPRGAYIFCCKRAQNIFLRFRNGRSKLLFMEKSNKRKYK